MNFFRNIEDQLILFEGYTTHKFNRNFEKINKSRAYGIQFLVKRVLHQEEYCHIQKSMNI